MCIFCRLMCEIGQVRMAVYRVIGNISQTHLTSKSHVCTEAKKCFTNTVLVHWFRTFRY